MYKDQGVNKREKQKITINERTERLNSLFCNFLTNESLNNEDKALFLDIMLEIGVKIPKDKETLALALKNGFSEIVKISIENGARVEEEFFVLALEKGDFEFANFLLDKAKNLCQSWGKGLEKVITLKQVEIVKKFITFGYDVNSNDGLALITAIRCCDEEIFDLLVEAGADVKIKNNMPIIVAVSDKENIKIVEKLISLGVDVTAGNNAALYNCLHSQCSSPDILKILINEGVDVTSRNCEALEYCIRNRIYNFVEILLSTNRYTQEYISFWLNYLCRTSLDVGFVKILLKYSPTKKTIKECLKIVYPYSNARGGKDIYNALKEALKKSKKKHHLF